MDLVWVADEHVGGHVDDNVAGRDGDTWSALKSSAENQNGGATWGLDKLHLVMFAGIAAQIHVTAYVTKVLVAKGCRLGLGRIVKRWVNRASTEIVCDY